MSGRSEPGRLQIFAILFMISIGWTAHAEEATPPCSPSDRLPACRSDGAACLDAIKKAGGGDPVQLACSAEAGCLAGKAGACGPLLQFLSQPTFARNLRARAAGFEAACHGGEPGACTVVVSLLAERLKSAKGDEASTLYLQMTRAAAKACAQGLGCAKVVAIMEAGGADPTSDEEAAAALESACSRGGDAAACAWVAKAYGDLSSSESRKTKCNQGIARACVAEAAERKLNGGDADAWLGAACAAGDCGSCGLRLRDDKGRLKVATDHTNAVTARDVCSKACAKGRLSACDQSHDLFMAGVGGDRDEAGAVVQRLAQCKRDSSACVLMARAWAVTASLPQDSEVSARLAEVCRTERDYAVRQPACAAPANRTALRGERVKCAGGDDAVCVALGRRLRDMSLHAQAAEVLSAACGRDRADACAALLDVRERGFDLPPLPADEVAKLKATATKACDTGDALACFDLAQADSGQGGAAAKKAMGLLAAACKKGGGAECRMAADMCEGYGRKVANDPRKAMSLRQSGCTAGDAQACVAAGVQADQESGDPSGSDKSGPLFLRACSLGHADGCVRLRRALPLPDGAGATLAAACKAGILDVCSP